ncbi:fumarylacetoacetate hydrolase family protein [Alicyclobacillus fodiniaquatilis]|uniref:Fumarylacetoacetate hydrolase family protein n=1 Tax=Alicyclobacillus fodiniaquatilis TaxID=1661150 RepID=A0ABW4JMP9_9BACL
MSQWAHWKDAADAIKEIRNVFCVGRNYRDHAIELGNAVPTRPMIFGKFTHALTPASGHLALPPGATDIHHELEIVLFIDKPVTNGAQAKDVVGGVALGLDLTDRPLQSRLKEQGHPWELAKSFIGSGILTDFYTSGDFQDVQQAVFSLQINGQTVQEGTPADMLFDFDTLVQYVHQHFGLHPGDILFTGTPAGVGPLHAGDTCTLVLDNTRLGELIIAN